MSVVRVTGETGETVPGVDVPSADVAEVDLLIERADLGPEVFTFIRAGDPIPAVLAPLPRHPHQRPEPEAAEPKPARRR